jgi:hypothetical protein
MSRTAKRVSMLGILLIAFGAFLLLRKFGVIGLRVHDIVWPVLTLFGLFIAGRGLAEGRRGRIVGGTVLFLYSIFFLIRSLDRYDVPFETILPATFLVFGVVFMMLFVNRPAEWYYIVPGLLLLAVGSSIMMTEYGYWYGWEVRDAISTWWPAALVLMGAGMLLRHGRGDSGTKPGGTGWPGETPGPESAGETGTADQSNQG